MTTGLLMALRTMSLAVTWRLRRRRWFHLEPDLRVVGVVIDPLAPYEYSTALLRFFQATDTSEERRARVKRREVVAHVKHVGVVEVRCDTPYAQLHVAQPPLIIGRRCHEIGLFYGDTLKLTADFKWGKEEDQLSPA